MKKFVVSLALLLFTYSSFSQEKPFWNEIQAFKKQDSLQFPKDGMMLFIGSSSFRLWKTKHFRMILIMKILSIELLVARHYWI